MYVIVVTVCAVALKIRAAEASKPLLGTVTLNGGALLVAWHAANETAIVKLSAVAAGFNFTAK